VADEVSSLGARPSSAALFLSPPKKIVNANEAIFRGIREE